MTKANLMVFFDIETVTINRDDEPKNQKAMEYVVSYKYRLNNQDYERVVPSLEFMINDLIKLKVDCNKIYLLAHNGEKYDFSFLLRKLIIEFGLTPKNAYVKQSTNHKLETKIKNEKGDYLHVTRMRSSTRTALKFRIKNRTFETKDTLPITHMSVRTIGSLLKDLGLDEKGKNVKLNYDDDYTKYDLKKDMDYKDLKDYCLHIYNQLTKSAKDYVMNDTRVIFKMYYSYEEIYSKGYDPNKLTLSQNILLQYKLNSLASFQLINEIDSETHKRLELTNYLFEKQTGEKLINMYEYIHKFYKGGLNFYNDNKVGKLLHGKIVHIDLNSSYPTVMRYEQFPTFCVDGGVINQDLELDDKYYYFIQMSKIAFENIYLRRLKSDIVHEMFVKYLNNASDSVFIQTPHLELLGKFLGEKISKVPAISFLKFKKAPFGGLDTIQVNYHLKTQAKKNHASKGEVAGYKVTLNGIYGIPALRPFFPLYEQDKDGNIISVKDENGNNAFHNKERNITFACSVTAYAFRNLLTPLTNNVSKIDDNFIYCDTDSIFMYKSYWNTIKDRVNCDKYALGAWDLEHKDITDMFVMNHKKYALYSNDNKKVEVFSGGIPTKAFHTEDYNNLKDFVNDRFYDGYKVKNLRNVFNKERVVILYEAETQINVGEKYIKHFPRNKKEMENSLLQYHLVLLVAGMKELETKSDESMLYYETPYGAFSHDEIFPPIYENTVASKLSFRSFLNMHKMLYNRISSTTDIKAIETKRKEKMKI